MARVRIDAPTSFTQFIDGRLEAGKTNTGQLYVQIPPFDFLKRTIADKFTGHSDVLAWLDEIPESQMNLLKKLDELPNQQVL